jgi:RsiW-degrading membrane proteinase PrsW (M82 family)
MAAYPMPGPIVSNPTGRPERRGWVTTGAIVTVFLVSLAALSVFFGIDIGVRGTLVAAAVSAVPLFVVVPVFIWVDRMEAEPRRYLLFAFLWGALCAAAGAIILNTGIHLGILDASPPSAEPDSRESRGGVTVLVHGESGVGKSSLTRRFVELVAEDDPSTLVLAGRCYEREAVPYKAVDGVIDGIVYAGMAGAGFAFSENILYLGRAFDEAGTSGLTEVFFLRCLMGPFAHPLFTACTGIGIGLAITVARTVAGRVGYGVAGLFVAMALHGIWNLSASLGTYLQVYLAFQMPVFAVFLVMLVLLRQHEQGLVRRYLTQYADAGWFTRAEVEMLSTMAHRRSARAWARGHGGRTAVRSMRAFQDSASDLALLRSRIVRGSAGSGAAAHERELLDTVTAYRGVLHGQVGLAAR